MRVSHPHFRYSCQHKLLWNLQHSFRCTFSGDHNVLLPWQVTGDRVQVTGNYIQLLMSPCNILVISLYSVLHILQVHSSTYPRSRQYLAHTLISSPEPTAILSYRIHSAFEYDLLPNPSAMFAHIDLLAFLICWPSPYCSTTGNSRLALCISKETLYAL